MPAPGGANMRALAEVMATGSQAASYLMGAVVLAAAGLAAVWSLQIADIAGWAFDVLGAGFISLLTLLVLATVYCLVQLRCARGDGEAADFWFVAGVQLASGVATLPSKRWRINSVDPWRDSSVRSEISSRASRSLRMK